MQHKRFIFIQVNWPTNSELLLNNSRTRGDLFRFWQTLKNKNTFEVFSFFQLSDIELNYVLLYDISRF